MTTCLILTHNCQPPSLSQLWKRPGLRILTADEWRGWLEPPKKNGKNSMTNASFKCLSVLLSNVNINFYVNKYLLRSRLGVKLQARLWGHNGEQYTGNIKTYYLKKKFTLLAYWCYRYIYQVLVVPKGLQGTRQTTRYISALKELAT